MCSYLKVIHRSKYIDKKIDLQLTTLSQVGASFIRTPLKYMLATTQAKTADCKSCISLSKLSIKVILQLGNRLCTFPILLGILIKLRVPNI